MQESRREQIRLTGGQSFRVLRWKRNLREVEALISPKERVGIRGEGATWHYHPEMELTYFATGNGTRFIGDHIGPFERGDLVLLGSNLPHFWNTTASSSGLSIQWSFPSEHPFWAFPETVAVIPLFENASRGIRYSGKTVQKIAAQMTLLAESSDINRLGELLRIFSVLLNSPRSERSMLSQKPFSLSREAVHQKAMRKAVQYLLAHFREEIRLESLLTLTAMSKPTFCRQFKRHSGKTFIEFLTSVRLEAACHQLLVSDRQILDIAYDCGFTQISFFNRIFRRLLRCNPRQFRKRVDVQSETTPPEVNL